MARRTRQLRDPGGMTLAQVVETDDGTVRVLVDGQPLPTNPIHRRDLGRVLSVQAEQRGPLRIELTDRAGRVFVDVLHPPIPLAPSVPPPAVDPPSAPPFVVEESPQLVEVSGEGFLPGEEVHVAVVVQTSGATRSGRARGLLDLDLLPDGVRGVLLLGTVSGTLTIEYLP